MGWIWVICLVLVLIGVVAFITEWIRDYIHALVYGDEKKILKETIFIVLTIVIWYIIFK